MSGQTGGQIRALPFTGFATLPMLVLGAVLSAAGVLMSVFKSKNADA
jgi:LPXTG-motif cell wall-anchored protein